jgi:murein DD-endopeptidase MepM/ murein hydrolase activator NlpD
MNIRNELLTLLFAIIMITFSNALLAGELLWPIGCKPGDSICSTNLGYPDTNNDGKAFDCSPPGYTGHQGTDIPLTSWNAMDTGVPVFSAADGEVLFVFDGKYDRCPNTNESDCKAPKGGVAPGQSEGYQVCTSVGNYCGTGDYGCYWCFNGGNVVVIKHIGINGVFATRYDHLKKNSILVSPGDVVSKGQKIAAVGSAGSSTGPHLHFEVWATGFYELGDPWAGTCGPNTTAPLWQNTPPWVSDPATTYTVTSDPAGINCGFISSNCKVDFKQNTLVTLKALADAKFTFTGWSGACSGTGNCIVTMNAVKTVTASFINAVTLTTVKAGNGSGVITSSPSGIICGADCSEDYVQGSQISLAAAPDVNSIFAGWSGTCSGTNSCIVTMSSAKSVTATFTLKPIDPLLTATKAGDGTGKVISTPIGIDCGTACSTTYLKKTVVTLSATPDSGSTFGSWSGGCSGVAVTCKVTMTAAKTVKATFKKIPSYLLTVVKAGTGTGTVVSSPVGIDCNADCTESYLSKTIVTLTATPDTTATFTSWSGGCTGKAACKVTMTAAKKITATFKKK